MANLKDIKRQIKSVQNTQKTTRAMKLVSTAKLKRTEEVAKRSREYANKLSEMLTEIAYKIQKFKIGGIESKYFNRIENPKKIDIIFITADKGLCGGFNIQTIRTVKKLLQEYKEQKVKVRLRGVGKKGIEFFKFNEVELYDVAYNLSSSPSYEKAADFINKAITDFIQEETEQIILIHNGYKNMITQEIKMLDLLPIKELPTFEDKSESLMEIEPDDDESVLDSLVHKYIEFNMYFALIDSLAAEHSARMQAMDAATKNAKELVNSLTVSYNKARQESITKELIEIISGMEALK